MHDKRTGNGKSVIRGTETYSGGWKDGEFHGRGVHCDARGNVYDGEVRCDEEIDVVFRKNRFGVQQQQVGIGMASKCGMLSYLLTRKTAV